MPPPAWRAMRSIPKGGGPGRPRRTPSRRWRCSASAAAGSKRARLALRRVNAAARGSLLHRVHEAALEGARQGHPVQAEGEGRGDLCLNDAPLLSREEDARELDRGADGDPRPLAEGAGHGKVEQPGGSDGAAHPLARTGDAGDLVMRENVVEPLGFYAQRKCGCSNVVRSRHNIPPIAGIL